eukprot:TRINITY_DN4479_c0_g1_i1.p2 TRINITY_DN4479_c0_g1~~TRINITY_DN4479_c0_g1_i1.p2  ORF type:complete len:58 (-),score=8.37 TRINITY_DN4479_c0_g1_i1:265-438(-)
MGREVEGDKLYTFPFFSSGDVFFFTGFAAGVLGVRTKVLGSWSKKLCFSSDAFPSDF